MKGGITPRTMLLIILLILLALAIAIYYLVASEMINRILIGG